MHHKKVLIVGSLFSQYYLMNLPLFMAKFTLKRIVVAIKWNLVFQEVGQICKLVALYEEQKICIKLLDLGTMTMDLENHSINYLKGCVHNSKNKTNLHSIHVKGTSTNVYLCQYCKSIRHNIHSFSFHNIQASQPFAATWLIEFDLFTINSN